MQKPVTPLGFTNPDLRKREGVVRSLGVDDGWPVIRV
jgi:hypothetical protein